MTVNFITPEEFFLLLYEESEFCDGVGKVMLAAGMLETNLRRYLNAKGVKGVCSKSTFGSMVKRLKDRSLLSRNGEMHFDDLVLKRNYLAHSLYDLFSRVIDETILPRDELARMDVETFADKAQTLAEEFLFFSRHVAAADIRKRQLL